MKRIIRITATYDLNDSKLIGAQLTPTKKVKDMITAQMIDLFSWDEGYEGVTVEVVDE